jgi:HEAT repeat protein
MAADEALLKEAGVVPDGPGLLEFFRKRSLTEADRQRLEQRVRQLGSRAYRERTKATSELMQMGPPSLPFLRAALKDPDLEIVRRAQKCIDYIERGPGPTLPAAAAHLLARRQPPGAVSSLLTYLPYIDDEWLEDEVLVSLGFLSLHQGKVDPLLTAALSDRLAVRRAGAAFILGLMGDQEQRAAVRRLLADPEAVVRRRAAWGLIGKDLYRSADDMASSDRELLRQAKVGTDAPALLVFFRQRSLSEADRQHLQALVRQLGDASFKKRKLASQELVKFGSPTLAYLKPALKDPDLEVRQRADKCIEAIERGPGTALPAAAVRLLVRQAPAEAIRTLLTYVPSSDDDSVEEAVLSGLITLSVREEKLDAALAAALQDPEPARRGAAAYVLGRVGTKADCQAVRKLLTDPDLRVRFRAAQGLVYAKDKVGLPVLLALLGDKSPRAPTYQVQEVLRQVAAEKAPSASVTEGLPEERKKAREAWLAWWREQGGKLDLVRLNRQEAQLGLTVICEFDGTRSGGGHAWEFGRDFRPRWKIEGLQGPMDAHVLAGSKVLIAEYYGMRVTERNFKGEVKWDYRVATYPIACSRQPNGNTFIATYSSVMEVTRDKKVVYNYARGMDGQIYSAQKARNGHIWYITSAGWVVELDSKDGKQLRKFNVGNPGAWCGIEWLPNGRLLVTLMVTGEVKEIDAATGRTVYWKTTVTGAHQTLRLPNGNTMIVCMNNKRLVEVDRAGKVLWDRPMEGRPWRVHRR